MEKNGVKGLVGEMGLEAIYDEILAGKNGYKVYQKDAKGFILPNGVLKQKDAVDGQDIYLTLNSSLQRDLDHLLTKEAGEAGANKASAVIMEAKTGKILALSNYPSFNPNDRKINDYKNFFFDTAYECGSVLNHLFMLVQLKVVCIMVVHYMNLVNMIMVVVDQFVIIIMELVGEVFLMMKGFIALVMLLFVTY